MSDKFVIPHHAAKGFISTAAKDLLVDMRHSDSDQARVAQIIIKSSQVFLMKSFNCDIYFVGYSPLDGCVVVKYRTKDEVSKVAVFPMSGGSSIDVSEDSLAGELSVVAGAF